MRRNGALQVRAVGPADELHHAPAQVQVERREGTAAVQACRMLCCLSPPPTELSAVIVRARGTQSGSVLALNSSRQCFEDTAMPSMKDLKTR